MVKAWKYGNVHEDYPIGVNEGWAVGEHLFICADIHTGSGQATLAHFMDTADYAYVDPPWTQGVFQGFYTKAGPGATLFDPCAGRGLTAKAAIQEGLNFIGVELHPRRLAWAIKYAVEATGERAERVGV